MDIKKTILPILIATIWISISEFVRNQLLLVSNWTKHYQKLGLTFATEPINGAVWGIWSIVFAIVIYIIAQKFSFIHTLILSWLIGFGMMWLVIGNLQVLPFDILPIAVPLSVLECFLATWIVFRFKD